MSDELAALAQDALTVLGQLRTASNATILCALPDGTRCVYKPVAGERPLWDFPDGTLARRELAFAGLDASLGVGSVPPTVWREEGPFGPGMCQRWIEEAEDASAVLVDVVAAGSADADFIVAFRGQDEEGNAVEVVHRNDPMLASIALVDAVANNADRKAGHLIRAQDGRLAAIDHGVTFHTEDKLRTVLWGWAGAPIPSDLAPLVAQLAAMQGSLPSSVTMWLDREECAALEARIAALVAEGRFPVPSGAWPAIPWPLY